MNPVIFECRPLGLHGYGVFIADGALLGLVALEMGGLSFAYLQPRMLAGGLGCDLQPGT